MTIGQQRAGRPRDVAHDARIVEAALDVLAESGYAGTTVDAVAARAGAARATVYRRWPTKLDLALAALRSLGPTAAAPDRLPDTGTLRGDLIAASTVETAEQQRRRIRVVTGLQAAALAEPRLAAMLSGDGLEPWIAVGHALIRRAMDRGEVPDGDADRYAQVLPLMSACRVIVQGLPMTPEFALGIIDDVLLPALRHPGAGTAPSKEPRP